MKKCPYCKAQLQENARFCLYCMKSLDEKQPVSFSRKRNFLPLALVVLLLVAMLLILARCRSNPAPVIDASPDEVTLRSPTTATTEAEKILTTTEPQSEEQTEATTPLQEEPTTSAPPEEPVTPTSPTEPTTSTPPEHTTSTPPTEPTTSTPPEPMTSTPPTEPKEPQVPTCDHQYQITKHVASTCTTDGSCTYTCNLCGDSYKEKNPATGHSYQAATCVLPQICTLCEAEGADALGHSYQAGSCIRCQKPDPRAPENVYEYRQAQPGDQLSEGSYDPETDIVITGVKTVAQDGVYEIPNTINGKRVVAICPLAFSGANPRKVTLGKNIIYVSQNAFSGCYDIEALYIRSNYLFLSRSALIVASSRNVTLKIYCSSQCVVDDDLNGDCYLKDMVRVYGGEFHEWNG